MQMDLLPSQPRNHLVVMGNEWPQMSLSFQEALESPTDTSSSTASSGEATAGHDGSSFLSRTNDESMEGRSKHWIQVNNLSCGTTDNELKKLFYPYGGDEAFTVWEQDGALVGFVGFEMGEMACIAAEKMNAFIPCRQTHALVVRRVALDDVALARHRATSDTFKRPLAVLLQGSFPEQAVTTALLSRVGDPSQCATEVVLEVGRATQAGLRHLLCSLLAVSLHTGDSNVPRFLDELLKELLRCLLEAEDSLGDMDGGGFLAPRAQAVVNSGAVLGNLFALGILPGDPFAFASRLLQRTGAGSVAQVNGICAVAHACHALPFPISKASFWALVGHTAAEARSPQLRETLLAHLRQLKLVPQFPPTDSFFSFPTFTTGSQAPQSRVGSPLSPGQQQQSRLSSLGSPVARAAPVPDARLRTIHISHLPPQLSQSDLMSLLLRAGPVNKVRLCIGNGYTTLFAFVEMQSVEGARAVTLMFNNVNMMSFCIRVQSARNPIQDVVSEDAVYSRSGATLKPCTFGNATVPVVSCAISVQANERA